MKKQHTETPKNLQHLSYGGFVKFLIVPDKWNCCDLTKQKIKMRIEILKIHLEMTWDFFYKKLRGTKVLKIVI